MITKFIKKLSNEVALVGEYQGESLWNIRLVSSMPHGPKARGDYSEGELPSRETLVLGGFMATNYVGLNLDRHYRVEDATGSVVFRDSLY